MATATHPLRTLHLTSIETVVTLPVRFDVHTIGPLLEQLTPFTTSAQKVSLDGSCVEHVDNAGLELLQILRSTVEDVGGQLTVTNMSLALRLGIELSGRPGLPVERSEDLLLDFGTAA